MVSFVGSVNREEKDVLDLPKAVANILLSSHRRLEFVDQLFALPTPIQQVSLPLLSLDPQPTNHNTSHHMGDEDPPLYTTVLLGVLTYG